MLLDILNQTKYRWTFMENVTFRCSKCMVVVLSFSSPPPLSLSLGFMIPLSIRRLSLSALCNEHGIEAMWSCYKSDTEYEPPLILLFYNIRLLFLFVCPIFSRFFVIVIVAPVCLDRFFVCTATATIFGATSPASHRIQAPLLHCTKKQNKQKCRKNCNGIRFLLLCPSYSPEYSWNSI